MLGKLTHWLSAKLELEGGKDDDSIRQRFDALARMKKATLDVVQTAHERLLSDTSALPEDANSNDTSGSSNSSSNSSDDTTATVSAATEPNDQLNTTSSSNTSDAVATAPSETTPVILTEDDPCVHAYGAALENCLQLGLKTPTSSNSPSISLWNVLYSSSLVVDEPELVQSIQTAALLSDTDDGKARCWLKIALNKHALESTLLLIFSVQCDEVIRSSYDDWSVMRCCDSMGLFLQMVMDVRNVHFAIQVSDAPFHVAAPVDIPNIPIVQVAADESTTATNDANDDNEPATDAAAAPEATEPSLSAPDDASAPPMDALVDSDESLDESASHIYFPHRHNSKTNIKPWQHVFGVYLTYLARNPFHARFALIDPALAIPNLVQDCIDFLLETPTAPRLFRTTVVNVHINQLREIVETDGALPPDLDAPGAAALLLDFFKNLPEPLLTSDKYDAFVASGQLKNEDASIRNITCLVQDLPLCHRVVLDKLIAMMHTLVAPENAALNGLDIATASTTLAPVIAFKNEPPQQQQQQQRGSIGQRRSTHSLYQDVRFAAVGAQVVERMIVHYDVIFQDVRVLVSDALTRLEAKKALLLSMYQLFKMKPQLNYMADKHDIDAITRAFTASVASTKSSTQLDPAVSPPLTAVESTANNDAVIDVVDVKAPSAASLSPMRQRVSMPEVPALELGPRSCSTSLLAERMAQPTDTGLGSGSDATSSRTASGTHTHSLPNFRTASGSNTTIGIGVSRRQTITTSNPFMRLPPTQQQHAGSNSLAESLNAVFDRAVVDVWEQHGFNRPTILGNFDKGGVLLLRSVAYLLKTTPDIVTLLRERALPSETPTYDAGLVAAAICKSLIHVLKLVPLPEDPSINIVALSVEPFWELFDDDAYFYKLFALLFHMFEQLWSAMDRDEASFTRVFCDTEARLQELLKTTSPSCVDDLRTAWDERWRLLMEAPTRDNDENDENEDENDGSGSTDDEASSTLPLGATVHNADSSSSLPPVPLSRINKKPSFNYRPEEYASKLLMPSNILSLEHVALLDHALPITSQLCRWCLLYSTDAHGSSLHTLLMMARGQSPTLLVVQDDQNNVFGGYATDEWHRATQYYGTGETFLFTFSSNGSSSSSVAGAGSNSSTSAASSRPTFIKYPWSRRNNYFLLCSEESLVMGGGGSFGLYLDNDLSTGSTGACETFSSRPLVSAQEFTTVHVELWGFTTSDAPLPQRSDVHKRSVLD